MPTIRKASPADIAEIVTIWQHSLALHSQRDVIFMPSELGHLHFQAFVTEQMAVDTTLRLVAEVAGVVAAYGICLSQRNCSALA